jgi:Tetratricopeptide repeat
MTPYARKLTARLAIATFVLALPLSAALAAGGGGAGASGGGGNTGGGDGGTSGGATAATDDNGLENGNRVLTIPDDSVANAAFLDAQKAIASRQFYLAVSDLQQVLQRQPDNADVLNLMGFSNRKLGKQSEALGYYKKALALQPHHIGANEYLGELYLEMKMPGKAKEQLAALHDACGSCMEYNELKEKIGKSQTASE